MTFVGMDPERVRRIAEQLQQQGTRITTISEDVQRVIDQSIGGWEGVDYQDFSGAWSGQHRLMLSSAAQGVVTMATSVLEDVAEQELASGLTGSGGPGDPGGPGLLDTLNAATLLQGGLSALVGIGSGSWSLFNLTRMLRSTDPVFKAVKELSALRKILGHGPAVAQLAAKYGLTEAQILANQGRFLTATAALNNPLVAKIGTRVLAPLAIAGGGYELYGAITGDGPVDDRIAQGLSGTASIAGGLATVAVAAGLISNPVGWGIIAGSAVVAGGAWVYQNWDKVEGAYNTVTEGISDGLEATGEFLSDAGDKAGEVLSDVGGGIKDAGGKVLGAFGLG